MSSSHFKAYADPMDLQREFILIRCTDKNAFLESFFSIFRLSFYR